MTDREAIEKLVDGDLSGLEELVMRYQDKGMRVVYLIVQDRPSAEDIVVDTFLRIAKRIKSFRADQPFEPYLMRSLVNAALNATRRQSISLGDEEAETKLVELITTTNSIEDQVEAKQLRMEILQAIASLTLRQRSVIVQRYYLGLSEEEMSAALNAPRGTIKWLLHNARRNLRVLLNR